MSRTYKATGINLKTQALGEADRIVTILTQEFGLIRAIAQVHVNTTQVWVVEAGCL